MSCPSVLLIASTPLWVAGVHHVLRGFYPGLHCAYAASGSEALALASRQRFDVMLAELFLPDMQATDLLRRFREGPRLPPALLFGEERHLGSMTPIVLQAGARALLSQRLTAHELGEVMSQVLEFSLSPDDGQGPRLTVRERQILAALAEGLSNRALSELFHVSAGTLKTHLRSLFHKFAASNRTACVAAARRAGLV